MTLLQALKQCSRLGCGCRPIGKQGPVLTLGMLPTSLEVMVGDWVTCPQSGTETHNGPTLSSVFGAELEDSPLRYSLSDVFHDLLGGKDGSRLTLSCLL